MVTLIRGRLGLACLLLVVLFGSVGVADHWNKTKRLNHAEWAEWYCTHRHTHCGGSSSDRIEAHWNERQLGYETAIAMFGTLGLGDLLVTLKAGRKRGGR